MQIGKVIDLKYFNKFYSVIRTNLVPIIFCLMFLFGFGFGITSTVKSQSFFDFSKRLFDDYTFLRLNSEFLKITCNSFLLSFTYIVLLFISGASVLGIAVLPFAVFYKGITYGAIMAYLYNEFSLKGIAFNSVMILPAATVFVTAMILSACESFSFSLKLAKITMPKTSPTNLFFDFKSYCKRYFAYLFLVLFSGIIDGFVSTYFSVNFSL